MSEWKDRLRGMRERLAGLPGRSAAALRRVWSSERRRRRAWVILGAAVVVVALWNGSARVAEGQVAVLVNNMTGTVTVNERVGYYVFVPWLTSLHRLDRRVQALVMAEAGRDGYRGGDAIKVKTSDGSNVELDTLVSYRLIPGMAGQVLRDAGEGLAFGQLWVRSAVRAMAWREFGQLTTEQIYDTSLRNERARAMIEGLNRELAGRGIEVIAVVPQDLRFYKEYQEVIKKKKLADQEVEEQRAKARLAGEEQKKKVSEADFAAKASVAVARGEAERIRAEADGYVQRVRLEAEAELAQAQAQAQGLEATGLAEAEGMQLAVAALAGSGGVNLVALEYARQLQKIRFTGVPVLQDATMGQYRITQAPAVDPVPAAAIGAFKP